jgi:hypothetical protein
MTPHRQDVQDAFSGYIDAKIKPAAKKGAKGVNETNATNATNETKPAEPAAAPATPATPALHQNKKKDDADPAGDPGDGAKAEKPEKPLNKSKKVNKTEEHLKDIREAFSGHLDKYGNSVLKLTSSAVKAYANATKAVVHNASLQ